MLIDKADYYGTFARTLFLVGLVVYAMQPWVPVFMEIIVGVFFSMLLGLHIALLEVDRRIFNGQEKMIKWYEELAISQNKTVAKYSDVIDEQRKLIDELDNKEVK